MKYLRTFRKAASNGIMCLKHVIILAELFPPDMGGGGTRASNAVKGLLMQSVFVTIITAFPHYPKGQTPREYRWKFLEVENYPNHRIVRVWVPPLPSTGMINRFFLFGIFIATSLLGLPYAFGGQIVLASNPNVISFFPAMVYGYVLKCPVVLNIDDLWPEAPIQLDMMKSPFLISLTGTLAYFVYRSADLLTPISPGYIPQLTNLYGIDGQKIRLIAGGVDTSVFKPGEKHDTGKFVVLYIGAFSTGYDFMTVLDAAEQLQEDVDIVFRLQGAGELFPMIHERIRERGLENVELVDKIVPREEVPSVLHQGDVMLLPLKGSHAVQLGISTKLYEYQAVGKPIICISDGEHGRYVRSTKSGLVIKPKDVEALKKAVITLKNDPGLRSELAANGYNFVVNNVSLISIGKLFYKVFSELIAC